MAIRIDSDNKLSHKDRLKQEGIVFGHSSTYNGTPSAAATIGQLIPPVGFNLWIDQASITSDAEEVANVQFAISETWAFGTSNANILSRRGTASKAAGFFATINEYATGGSSCGFSVRDAMSGAAKLVSSFGGALITDDMRYNARYKMLQLGDSVTVGSVGAIGSFTGSDIFPWQVRDSLLDSGCDIRLINKGLGGKNSTDLENYRLARGVDVPAHLVLYSMGINDVGGGTFNEATYRANVTAMIQHTKRMYGRRVFVLLGPSPVYQTARHDNLELLRAAAADLVSDLGDNRVFYYNMGESFDRLDTSFYSSTDLSERPTDMVHPNKAGHLLLSAGINAFIEENGIISLIR